MMSRSVECSLVGAVFAVYTSVDKTEAAIQTSQCGRWESRESQSLTAAQLLGLAPCISAAGIPSKGPDIPRCSLETPRKNRAGGQTASS